MGSEVSCFPMALDNNDGKNKMQVVLEIGATTLIVAGAVLAYYLNQVWEQVSQLLNKTY